jgi:hypothetical protein
VKTKKIKDDLQPTQEFWKKIPQQIKGEFPNFLNKTQASSFDELNKKTIQEFNGVSFIATVKMDGTSFTAYLKDKEFGVCSRNFELKKVDNDLSVYWIIAEKYNLHKKLKSFCKNNKWNIKNVCLQGEIVGPNIQNNPLNLTDYEFYVFDVFDIDKNSYLNYDDELAICKILDLKYVKVLTDLFTFDKDKHDLKYFLDKVNQYYYDETQTPIEGLVFKSLFNSYSENLKNRPKFKVVNKSR